MSKCFLCNTTKLVNIEIFFYRIKALNEKFPMMNEMAEEEFQLVKATEEGIVRSAKELKHEGGDLYTGCMVENMKPHILSDLCLIQKEKSIPSVKPCHHPAEKR